MPTLKSIMPLALAAATLLLVLTGAACTASDDSCDSEQIGIICTIAGTGENGYDIDGDTADYPAVQAKLSLPIDTLTASDGTIYVIDWNNHRLRAVRDRVISWVAGTSDLGGPFFDDPSQGHLNHPSNIIFDAAGESIYVAAWHNSQLRKLDLSTGTVENIAGDGKRAYFGDGGPALSASFDLPSALALNPEGELVIMDQANQVLRAIDASGVIRRIAGQCLGYEPESTLEVCEAPVQCPAGESGPSGKFVCGGDMSLCNSPCRPGYNGDEVMATEMRMAQPFGGPVIPSGRMLFNAAGDLFFADTSNHLIRRIDRDGVVHLVAGTPPIGGVPQRGYAGDGGDAREALLNSPVDLALADDGTLYFTDVYNHCVRSIAPDSTIATVAGVCGERGFAGDDGPAELALLRTPFGVEWSDGRLLISDTANHVIRSVRVTP